MGRHSVANPERALPATTTSNSDVPESEREITLDLLDAVHENGQQSQRSLASELGIALGLTNAYLKRCIRKGWIKARQAPPNRYAYYLTPKGFSEKSRLTTQYLRNSLRFYRRARNEMGEVLNFAAGQGWKRVALAGRGDLAEITILCAMQHKVQIVGVIDRNTGDTQFMQRPLVDDLSALGTVDAVVVTDLETPQRTYDELAPQVPGGRLVAPPLLKITQDDLPERKR